MSKTSEQLEKEYNKEYFREYQLVAIGNIMYQIPKSRMCKRLQVAKSLSYLVVSKELAELHACEHYEEDHGEQS